jgi:hypothetical protein
VLAQHATAASVRFVASRKVWITDDRDAIHLAGVTLVVC